MNDPDGYFSQDLLRVGWLCDNDEHGGFLGRMTTHSTNSLVAWRATVRQQLVNERTRGVAIFRYL